MSFIKADESKFTRLKMDLGLGTGTGNSHFSLKVTKAKDFIIVFKSNPGFSVVVAALVRVAPWYAAAA